MSVTLLQHGSLFSIPVTTSCHPLEDMALLSWMTLPRMTTRAAIGLASLSSAVSGQAVRPLCLLSRTCVPSLTGYRNCRCRLHGKV